MKIEDYLCGKMRRDVPFDPAVDVHSSMIVTPEVIGMSQNEIDAICAKLPNPEKEAS